MKTCIRCRKTDIDDSAAFCPVCGLSLRYNDDSKERKTVETSASLSAIVLTVLIILGLAGGVIIYFVGRGGKTPGFSPSSGQGKPVHTFAEAYDENTSVAEEQEEEEEETYEEDADASQEQEEETGGEEAEPEESINDQDYILPDSATRYITEEDLSVLDKDGCWFARNEIYARHGRRFNNDTLQEYFDSKDWYEGTIAPDDFTDKMLSEIELTNAKFIESYEYKMGYRN